MKVTCVENVFDIHVCMTTKSNFQVDCKFDDEESRRSVWFVWFVLLYHLYTYGLYLDVLFSSKMSMMTCTRLSRIEQEYETIYIYIYMYHQLNLEESGKWFLSSFLYHQKIILIFHDLLKIVFIQNRKISKEL